MVFIREKRIETNIKKAWYENGLLMLQIQEEELYKARQDNFDDYMWERWKLKRSHVYRLIDSAKCMAQLTSKSVPQNSLLGDISEDDFPQNERQIRPLTALEKTGEKLHVWKMVVDAKRENGEKITGLGMYHRLNNPLKKPFFSVILAWCSSSPINRFSRSLANSSCLVSNSI